MLFYFANPSLPGFALGKPDDMFNQYRHIDRYLDKIHQTEFKRENPMFLIRLIGRQT